MANDSITLYRAAGVYDAKGLRARPGAVAVRKGGILAAGTPSDVRSKLADSAIDVVVEMNDHLLLPALVNAHTHLDLSFAGPRPYGGSFVGWIEQVLGLRAEPTYNVAEAVRQGLRLSRANGVGWIGDIAGSVEAVKAWLDMDLVRQEAIRKTGVFAMNTVNGTSWLECLGRGERAKAVVATVMETLNSLYPGEMSLVWPGLEAHAPYSAAAEIYQSIDGIGTPSTHMAETLEEEQFVRDASGPFADFLRRIGRWDDSIVPTGKSPVAWFTDLIKNKDRWVAAHCNYVSNDDITRLARHGVSVAYCPIASEYFGHPLGGREPHRYREMIDAGINVCLGTDSIICQPPDEPQPMSIFAAMRRLYQRDQFEPQLLLEMATTNGLRAMDWHPSLATFSSQCGMSTKIIAVRIDPTDPRDLLQQALLNRYPVEPVSIA